VEGCPIFDDERARETNSFGRTEEIPGGSMRRGKYVSRLVGKKQAHPRKGRGTASSHPAKPVSDVRNLIAGPEVKLLTISRAGALLESESRLFTGSHICLRLNAGDATFLLKGRVLRSRPSTPEGCAARYESAVAFEDDFVLHEEDLPRAMKVERKPARGSRPRPAGEPPGASPALRFVPSAAGFGPPPTILSEASLADQTGTDLRRILGIA
jgi:hypothetical protein